MTLDNDNRYETHDYLFLYFGNLRKVVVWHKTNLDAPMDAFTPDPFAESLEAIALEWVDNNTVVLNENCWTT